MNICLVGGGNIAEAIVKGLLKKGTAPESLIVTDPTESRRTWLGDQYGIRTESDNRKAAAEGDLVILAVKPKIISPVCEEISTEVSDKLVVSVAAGVKSSVILAALGERARLIRVMPNTPALVGEGMCALSRAGGASETDLETVRAVFDCLGRTTVLGEDLLDAVTGLSGSGPAYVFLLIEAMADGGVKAGLPREDALLLAAQTVLGAARMVLETGIHPGKLKDMVASPGGTTIEGLSVLEDAGVRGTVIKAVTAAYKKSRKIGRR